MFWESWFLYREDLCGKFFLAEQAASPGAGSLTLPLMTNLKKVRVRISGLEEEEIALLDCLPRNAPSLLTMRLTLPICFENFHDQSILKQLLGLNRFSGQATVLITANHGNKCERCLASSDDDWPLQNSLFFISISDTIESFLMIIKLRFGLYSFRVFSGFGCYSGSLQSLQNPSATLS